MKTKFGPIYKKIVELSIQKIVIKLSKIWVWDLGSGVRDPRSEIRDPGSGKNLFGIPDPGSKRHRIPDPDPQHCMVL
jgi:hypothetical protein